MELLDLPNEILFSIADFLSIEDLSGLPSTCPELSSLFTSYLYNRLLEEVKGPTPLGWAAQHGHIPLVKLAISSGARIDGSRPWDNVQTSLHFAARYNHPVIIRILVKHGARINANCLLFDTPLHLATKYGNVEATRVLIVLGADMMCTNVKKHTPADNAVIWGGVGCTKAFIDAGCHFNFNARWGYQDRTILHGAVLRQDLETLEYLLGQEGAEVAINERDDFGATPLHLATGYNGNFKAEFVRPLLHHGADMYAVDKVGNTPAHYALYAREDGEFGCMGALLDAGFDFKTRESSGRTIIHLAVIKKRVKMLGYLLGKAGAKVAINARDCNGETPLHLTVHYYGNRGSCPVKLLLRHGADMYAVNHDGDTTAHRAVHAREPYEFALISALLDAGFDFNTRGNRGRTILHEAVVASAEAMLKYLLGQAGAGVVINAQDSDGLTPLYLAARERYGWKQARVLLEHGADIGLRDIDGDTAAHTAAAEGNILCMKALLVAGFDINTRGNRGRTILHRAVIGGEKMVEYLLEKQGGVVLINTKDSEGLTPLDYAARHRNRRTNLEEVVRLLLQYGADTKTEENSGNKLIARGPVKGVERQLGGVGYSRLERANKCRLM